MPAKNAMPQRSIPHLTPFSDPSGTAGHAKRAGVASIKQNLATAINDLRTHRQAISTAMRGKAKKGMRS